MKIAGQLWAIALLTLRKPVRRKTFLPLIFFAVAVLSSMTFFASVDPASRLRLLEMWSLRATVFFAALVAIFLGAFTLPADFEEKHIHVITTKPVGKSTFLLGRYLGMAVTVAIFVAIMGLISLAFLKTVKWVEGDSIPDLRARPIVSAEMLEGLGRVEQYTPDPDLHRTTGQVPGTLVWLFHDLPVEANRLEGRLGIRNNFFPDQGNGTVRFQIIGAGGKSQEEEKKLRNHEPFHLVFPRNLVEKGSPLQVSITPAQGDIQLDADQDSIRILGRAATRFGSEGSTTKLESPPRLQAQSWARSALSWKFENMDADRFPEFISGRIRVNINPLKSLFRSIGPARIVIWTSDGTRHVQENLFTKSNEWTDFSFPRTCIESGQEIRVALVAGDDDMRLAGRTTSCQLFEKDESFSWNFLKGFILVYCWILLILTVTVVASSLVSGPVSVLTGIVVLVVGSGYGFATEAVRDVDRSLVRYYEAERQGEKARTPEDFPPWLLEYSRTGSRIALFIFPDARDFDFSSFLLSDLAVQGPDLWRAFKALLSRVVILLLLGVVVMMYKDFG